MTTAPQPAFVLETPRLRLRHVRESDLDACMNIYGDPVAMRFFRQVYSRDEVLEVFIRRNIQRYANVGYGQFAVELKPTSEVAGLAGPTLQDGPGGEKMIEVGYHFNPSFWGHGYATEAARAAMEYCFDKLGAAFIVSFIDPENLASRRVAQRNGLKVWTSFDWHGALHDVWRTEREAFQAGIRLRGN